jgi:hypothetical protein
VSRTRCRTASPAPSAAAPPGGPAAAIVAALPAAPALPRQIYEGTNQIQRVVMARQILKG